MTDLEKIIDHYGEEHQLNKVVEELGELITAISKWRNGKLGITELVGEVVDVKIMIEQLYLITQPQYPNINLNLKSQRLREYKLQRTLTQIENDGKTKNL
jgi:hypothetical protein